MLEEYGAILIELAMHAVDGTYAVPGGQLLRGERSSIRIPKEAPVVNIPSALLGAAREWHEEVLGLEGEAAVDAARTFVQEALDEGRIRGPYGDVHKTKHAAYLYEMRPHDNIDEWASRFVLNNEANSILVVPVSGL